MIAPVHPDGSSNADEFIAPLDLAAEPLDGPAVQLRKAMSAGTSA
jgi:hypothetical protein